MELPTPEEMRGMRAAVKAADALGPALFTARREPQLVRELLTAEILQQTEAGTDESDIMIELAQMVSDAYKVIDALTGILEGLRPDLDIDATFSAGVVRATAAQAAAEAAVEAAREARKNR